MGPRADTRPLLEFRNITVAFPPPRGVRNATPMVALDSVSLTVSAGESVGIIGDSGAGKTTLAKVVVGLARPTAGSLLIDGSDVTRASSAEWRRMRGNVGLVFQDALGSFNPMLPIEYALGRPLHAYTQLRGEDVKLEVARIMQRVGLRPSQMTRYPHEFSGGQIQRLAIARALITKPKLLVLDEPVSALDVSIRAQVLNLLADLAGEFSLTYLLIGSDPAVIEHMTQRALIMYGGRVIESGPLDEVYRSPKHPYTASLLELRSKSAGSPGLQLAANRSSGRHPLVWDGCPFAGVCPLELDRCATVRPEPVETTAGHLVTCHAYEPGARRSESSRSSVTNG